MDFVIIFIACKRYEMYGEKSMRCVCFINRVEDWQSDSILDY